MEYLYKPDYDKTLRRFEAFWEREIIDRPPVSIALPKEGEGPSRPGRTYATLEEKWLDIDGRIEAMEESMARTDYL